MNEDDGFGSDHEYEEEPVDLHITEVSRPGCRACNGLIADLPKCIIIMRGAFSVTWKHSLVNLLHTSAVITGHEWRHHAVAAAPWSCSMMTCIRCAWRMDWQA